MDKLILTLTAFASVVMPVIGGEPIGPVLATPTTSDQDALILRILKAVETHDYRTLLIYTLDKETDYFGHKNSSNAFIQQDMTQDARSYKWCRFVPDLSTFQTSLGHDSIEYDSDALDVRGKEHKARCRFDIYYTPTTSPRLQALSLRVLPNHLESGKSESTVTGPVSGQRMEITAAVISNFDPKGEVIGEPNNFSTKVHGVRIPLEVLPNTAHNLPIPSPTAP
jgi:hypothetical protein